MTEDYVLNQLSPKEKIEYQHTVGSVTWLATTKRVLRFSNSPLGSKSLRDLDYRHIVSINLEEKRFLWLLVVSAFLIILGLYSQNSAAFLFLTLSAVLVGAVAIFYRPSFYQFNASAINFEDWRMKDTKTARGKELIQTIRKHCFFESKY